MLFSSKIYQASRDMVTVYVVVAYAAAASVIGIMIFAYFDQKYGKPASADQGGSSIDPHGGPVTLKSFKFINRKIIWIAVVNTWFA
jgi:nitrate/nitrite transporter NarK